MKKKTKGHIKKPAIKFRRWRDYQLEIKKKQPIIHVTSSQYFKLMIKLIHVLLASRYRPDIIICVATGGFVWRYHCPRSRHSLWRLDGAGLSSDRYNIS